MPSETEDMAQKMTLQYS